MTVGRKIYSPVTFYDRISEHHFVNKVHLRAVSHLHWPMEVNHFTMM